MRFNEIPWDIGEYLEYQPDDGGLYVIKKYCKNQPVGKRAGTIHHVKSSSRRKREDDLYKTRRIRFKGKDYAEHRAVWFLVYGEEAREQIDHINRDATDNRIWNLRLLSQAGNMQNTSLRSDSSSGVKGVSPRRNGSWRAYINIKGKRRNLGTYETRADAILARTRAEDYLGFNDDEHYYATLRAEQKEQINE